MHDLKRIREQPEAFDRALARRGLAGQSTVLLALDQQNRQVQTELQELQARRNEVSRAIGKLKSRSGDSAEELAWTEPDGSDAETLMAEVQAIKERMAALEEESRRLDEDLKGLLAGIPNILADDVPDGPDESANVELRAWGAKPSFDFQPKEHWELGEALGLLDFETAARLSGSRFVVMKGAIARLHRALGQFMIDLHTRENGYLEVAPPYLVRDHVLFGTNQLPKFAEDQFRTTDDFWLIPTAEVPLTNLAAGQIYKAGELPIRVTALTPCFRSEAGSAGRDTRGMLRQHQFEKVELVSIVHPDDSEAEQQRMTGCAESVLQSLGLPYRVMVLSSGDTGFGARRTFDIEVWLPGQGAYREISSCSTCGDFQARRMNARFRPEGEKGTRFLHTLNGSGVAVGRALIAVMENYQRADGTIAVPEALRPYLGGLEVIGG